MAIVDIDSNATFSFDSTDTVTWKTSGDIGDDNNVTKTDALAMDILIDDGIINTISGTGFTDIKGGRNEWVHFRSSAAVENRVRGSWLYFEYIGTSNSNTVKWAVYHNATFGLLFIGHEPTAGKFQYLVYNSTTTQSLLCQTGSCVLDDIYAVNGKGSTFASGTTQTINRIVYDRCTAIASTVGSDVTYNGVAHINHHLNAPVGSIAVGKTLVLNNFYYDSNHGASSAFAWGITGDLDINTAVMRGGRQIFFHPGTGDLTINDADLFGTTDETWILASTGGVATDNVALFGGNMADIDNFDISTADPSTNTPVQYGITGGGIHSIINPRSTRFEPLTVDTLSANVDVAGEVTFTASSNALAKMKILMTKESGDYDSGVAVASDWDAPDVIVAGLEWPLKCIFSDFGQSGKVYIKGVHSIKIDNLQSGTYFWKAVCQNAVGEMFESTEQGSIVVVATPPDTTPPVFDGGVSGVAAADNASGGDIIVSSNNATDPNGVRGYKYFIKDGDGEPFTTPDTVVEVLTNGEETIHVGTNILKSVGVRAFDTFDNGTTNTDFVTVAPTAAPSTEIVVGPIDLEINPD